VDKQKYQNVAIFVSSAGVGSTVIGTGSVLQIQVRIYLAFREYGSGSRSKETDKNKPDFQPFKKAVVPTLFYEKCREMHLNLE
jgi:hypothetical protein